MRILYITNYPTAYRVDFYNSLYERCVNGRDIRFLFIEEQSINAKSISDYTALFSKSSFFWPSCKEKFFRNFFNLIKLLLEFKPNRIVAGNLNWGLFLLIVFLKFFFWYKIYIWSGTTEQGAKYRKNEEKKNFFKRFVLRIINGFRKHCIAGGIFYSRLSRDYYFDQVGKLNDWFILGNNTRDAEKMYNSLKPYMPKNGENEYLRLISIGFQDERKNTKTLLQAVKLLKESGKDQFILEVVGDGVLLNELISYSRKSNLPVKFYGYVKPEETIRLLASADIFIHPSLRDYWPQVYTEALCCGKTILLSSASGVADEYTDEFGNEVMFDPENPQEIAEKIMCILDNKKRRLFLAQKALDTAFRCNAITQTPKLLEFLGYNTGILQ